MSSIPKKKKKKKKFNIFSYHTELTLIVRPFLSFRKKKSNDVILRNGAPHCNLFRIVMGTIDRPIDTIDSFQKKLSK